jgi:YggT family protein
MVVHIVENLIEIYMVMILLRALSTWLRLDTRHAVVKLLCWMTDPFLALIRRIAPPVAGSLDIAPAIGIVVLAVLEAIVRGVF